MSKHDQLQADEEFEADYFVQVAEQLVLEPNCSSNALHLYLVLLVYCRRKETAWPGQKSLAQHLKLSERQVRRLLEELREVGLISWQRAKEGGSNIYTLAKYNLKSPDHRTSMSAPPDIYVRTHRTSMSAPTGHPCPMNQHELNQHQKESRTNKHTCLFVVSANTFKNQYEDVPIKIGDSKLDIPRLITYIQEQQNITNPIGLLVKLIKDGKQYYPAREQRLRDEAAEMERRLAGWKKMASRH